MFKVLKEKKSTYNSIATKTILQKRPWNRYFQIKIENSSPADLHYKMN